MKKAPMIARILLGFIFFGAGLAGLLMKPEMPPNTPEKLITFMNGITATGYFFPLLKVTEVVCGALLLSGMFVPLALVILAPVTLNIFLTHAFIAPDGVILASVIGLLQIYLSFFAEPYKNKIKALFKK